MAWLCPGSDSDMVQSIPYLVTVTMICLLVSVLATRWRGGVLIVIWYGANSIWCFDKQPAIASIYGIPVNSTDLRPQKCYLLIDHLI